MIYNTINEIKAAFYEKFALNPFVVTIKGSNVTVPVVYARESSFNYSEARLQQQYPCVIINDFTPTERDTYKLVGTKYVANVRDTDDDDINDTGTIYYEPILMDFRFDVSIAAKGYLEHDAILNELYKMLIYEATLILSSVTIEGEELGEIVSLDVTPQTIPNIEGVFETVFDVRFGCWVYLKTPEDDILVQQINLTADNTTISIVQDNVDPDAPVIISDTATHWREQVVEVVGPVTTVQHPNLIRNASRIKSVIFVDGVPVRWAKYNITLDSVTGTFDFSAYGNVNDEIIFEYL